MFQNPYYFFYNGGPGGSLMQKFDKVSSNLQQHFVVVHWDQRETGQTLKLNKTTEPLTLQLFYNDTHDLVDSLLRQFRRSRLYLIGYSWGSGLGFYIADKYPECCMPTYSQPGDLTIQKRHHLAGNAKRKNG
jgi:pimeloyl-ACP methyl ester carboxylesterase